MKTRALLSCDSKTFSSKIEGMKFKELKRHIERIATDLGEKDVQAFIEAVMRSLFNQAELPQTRGEEMLPMLRVLESRGLMTEENEEQALRLVALCVVSMNQLARTAAREDRLTARQGGNHQHQHAGHCADPHCGHDHDAHAEGDVNAEAKTQV